MKETFPAQDPAVAWRELDGEVVMISHTENLLHCLNSTGSLIWKLADGTRTTREIAESVAAEFEVSSRQALADTEEFLGELARKGLLHPPRPSPRSGADV